MSQRVRSAQLQSVKKRSRGKSVVSNASVQTEYSWMSAKMKEHHTQWRRVVYFSYYAYCTHSVKFTAHCKYARKMELVGGGINVSYRVKSGKRRRENLHIIAYCVAMGWRTEWNHARRHNSDDKIKKQEKIVYFKCDTQFYCEIDWRHWHCRYTTRRRDATYLSVCHCVSVSACKFLSAEIRNLSLLFINWKCMWRARRTNCRRGVRCVDAEKWNKKKTNVMKQSPPYKFHCH